MQAVLKSTTAFLGLVRSSYVLLFTVLFKDKWHSAPIDTKLPISFSIYISLYKSIVSWDRSIANWNPVF